MDSFNLKIISCFYSTGSIETPDIVTVPKERIAAKLRSLTESGGKPALQVWYYEKIDLIKSFIRSERISDNNDHLSCIIGMLNTFAAAGHHRYAKGARLYVQLMQNRQDNTVFQ